MTSVQPSRSAVQARAAVGGDASRAIERDLRLNSRSIAKSAGKGVERVQQILGPESRTDAGWALLFTGVVLIRGDDNGSVARALTDEPMLQAGLTYAAFLSATVGDRVLMRPSSEMSARAPTLSGSRGQSSRP